MLIGNLIWQRQLPLKWKHFTIHCSTKTTTTFTFSFSKWRSRFYHWILTFWHSNCLLLFLFHQFAFHHFDNECCCCWQWPKIYFFFSKICLNICLILFCTACHLNMKIILICGSLLVYTIPNYAMIKWNSDIDDYISCSLFLQNTKVTIRHTKWRDAFSFVLVFFCVNWGSSNKIKAKTDFRLLVWKMPTKLIFNISASIVLQP